MADEGINLNEFDLDMPTPLQVMAIAVHETYKAFRYAGFNDKQAIYLTTCAANFGEPQTDDFYEEDSEDYDD